ncbi:hypothetical protein FRC14_007510 [Serendipita sp. 396]|nr:hypothetical protein FRC14_007510 [Serendipita sp. 396]KAG8786449.1 hypothetical protein FRC15_011411 [Serendipita sp. 397]KAG8801822.1 hypothetical protein FRC16_011023 [Serendipita sp. 398]KAG8825391.1 hypothetical protein FRC19_011507 [Serendipita sp. 401]KAG8843954.1 hypothetical protein FRB91_002969 [Serendipita sp. 411]KAG8870572.1 hypothetical protein FRC20_011665 [Serendipita sp. 405]KAG9056006.1 hypothetical protein FS842_000574 [Serendipita sp. 407]
MSNTNKGFLSSIADKAQAVIAGKLGSSGSSAHGHSDSTSSVPPPATGAQAPYNPPAQEQSGSLSGRHHGLETIQHHLRSLQVQYSSGISQENRQLQLLITASKGVALDYDTVGRDAKAQSKELFLWGQTQGDDIKDVTDRLAYLNFVHGALSYTLATDLDKSRAAWKNVRDAEAQLAPRRAARSNIAGQVNKLKTEGGRGGNVDTRLAELEAQLKKAESDDAPLENELQLLRRTAIKESETLKWKGLKEYGQKLILLAGASEQLLRVLPTSPPETYTGHQQTAAVRAALQNALDSGYVPQTEHLPLNVGSPAGGIGETRSFGETHAVELNSIATVTDNGHDAATPINPDALNNNPAPIPSTTHHYNAPSGPPAGHHYAAPSVAPPSEAHHPPTTYVSPTGGPTSSTSIPHAPTVAETGVPVKAGAEGPGPVAGSLSQGAEEVRERPTVGYGVGSNEQAPAYGSAAAVHESAEEEKRRLAAAEQNPAPSSAPSGSYGDHLGDLHASTSIRRPVVHESAEDEKKRLEREERERILRANTRQDTQDDQGGAAPPAYQEQ